MKKKNKVLLILIIVSIVILTLAIISIIFKIFNNKTKDVSAEYKENITDEEFPQINEESNDIIDITDLEDENIIEEELEEKEENNKTTNNQGQANTPPYYIKVNYGAQVVTIYEKDSQGDYTVPVKAMVCSTGTFTPKSGVYKIPNKWKWLGLQGDVYGKYSTQIVGNILFHSVPYLEKGNSGSLEYWEYDKLGTYASAGCIRLTVADALWIYNNCKIGTKVEFYSSSDPGPLGKPTAKKISNAPGDLKNWDPTDPDENNPWKNYRPEDDKKENTQIENKEKTNQETDNNNISNNITNNVIKNEIYDNEEINEVRENEVGENEVEENESIKDAKDIENLL